MDSSLILIIVLILLLFFSGFSSGSETGMMASNKVKLRNLSKKSKGAKRALNLLQRPDILLSAILVGNNFANILASSIVTLLVIDYFGGNVLLGSVILTIVILIFSEITPKTIASVYPEKFAEKYLNLSPEPWIRVVWTFLEPHWKVLKNEKCSENI